MRQKQEATNFEKLFSAGVAVAAVLLARKTLGTIWKRILHEEPPTNLNEDTTIPKAMLWATVAGAIVAGTRIASLRVTNKGLRALK